VVPTLRTDDGALITENAAILQYVADRMPAAQLAPSDGMERVRLQEWLSFIGTELHQRVFGPLVSTKMPEAAKAFALELSASRLALLERHLADRELLLARFSVADAYLVTVLGWAVATPIDLKKWPAIDGYLARLRQRPSVARAVREEYELYQRARARKQA
jgi:glutathione S-transferase